MWKDKFSAIKKTIPGKYFGPTETYSEDLQEASGDLSIEWKVKAVKVVVKVFPIKNSRRCTLKNGVVGIKRAENGI